MVFTPQSMVQINPPPYWNSLSSPGPHVIVTSRADLVTQNFAGNARENEMKTLAEMPTLMGFTY